MLKMTSAVFFAVFIATAIDLIHVENRITRWLGKRSSCLPIHTLISLTDGVHIEPMDLRDTNLNYNVVFDHVLKKGEEIEFRIKAVLSNKKQHFANFFSTEIITPIDGPFPEESFWQIQRKNGGF